MQKNGRPYSEADVRDYRLEVLNELAGRYNAGLRAANAVDFDDLLAFSARLLEESDVLERDSQLAFRYILVDEYQDTNRLQYRIVRALASAHKNITVVGDEDQSIYSWRGADIRNILEFERDFPGASILRLEENYRSTQAILDAASGLVVKNENRIGKTLKAMRRGGRQVESLVARDEYEEALKVATDIQRNGEGLRIACLYRMNAQSRALEEAFASARIRYQVVGAVGFYARREIRDVVSYLRLVLNPDDDSAFRRVINVPPRGVGEQTLGAITVAAQRRGVSLWAGLKDVLASDTLPSRTRSALGRFVSLVAELTGSQASIGPGALVETVIEKTEYEALIDEEPSPVREDRLQNLKELADGGHRLRRAGRPRLARVPGPDLPPRRRRLHPRRRSGPFDDASRRQGSRIRYGVPRRHGRGIDPAHARGAGPGTDGRGAAALLRGHDPGAKSAGV